MQRDCLASCCTRRKSDSETLLPRWLTRPPHHRGSASAQPKWLMNTTCCWASYTGPADSGSSKCRNPPETTRKGAGKWDGDTGITESTGQRLEHAQPPDRQTLDTPQKCVA